MEENLKTQFLTTQWTQILGSDGASPDQPARELVRLCENYRDPIDAFIRRSCGYVEDALDLTQGFFEFLIEMRIFQNASQERGRFRTLLLASAKNYLSNERRAAGRRNAVATIPTSLSMRELLRHDTPASHNVGKLTPDIIYDRQLSHVGIHP